MFFLLLASCLTVGLVWFSQQSNEVTLTPTAKEEPKVELIPKDTEPMVQAVEKTPYRCEAKTRCAEFTSCEEARFYQTHCSGAKLDKDHDGIPCEGTLCQHQ